MSGQTTNIQIRHARHDELGTILNWLDDPALLAATNLQRMATETNSRARETIKAKIADKLIWIAVRDNFRIGAVLIDSHDQNSGSAQNLSEQNSKSIFVYTEKLNINYQIDSKKFS